MRLRFLHAADLHLGYQQYGLVQRYDDFTDAFRWVVDTALAERVDFLLIAGDLFEKRTLDPRTLLIAVTEFKRLQAADIPVVAIEGNHERAYGDSLSWLEYLNHSGLLYLLDCAPGDHGWLPQPWDEAERAGGYVDLAGARIYGLKYRGAQTGAALHEIGTAIAAAPAAADFAILMSHTSVEGYFDLGHPFARLNELSALRPRIDYLALGHVHTPYSGALGGREWLFNPGCPETWSSTEWQYQDKGAYLVEVDTDRTPAFQATMRNYPRRRPFIHIRQEMDACPSPGALAQLLAEKIDREPEPAAVAESLAVEEGARAAGGSASHAPKAPVVEVLLTGIARFSRTEIDTGAIEQLVRRRFDPLLVRVRSSLQEAPASLVEGGDTLDRHVLERLVFENLIRADDRFAATAADAAQIAIALKQMTLDGVAAHEIAEEVTSRLRAQGQTARDDGSQPATASAADALPSAAVPGAPRGESGRDDEQLPLHAPQEWPAASDLAPAEDEKKPD